MIKKLTLLLVLCFLPVFAATAQDSQNALEIDEHITGLDIEQHFKQIEDLYTAKTPDMNAIRDFIVQYPLDDFILTNSVKTNREEQKAKTITKNKQQFIEEEKDKNYELWDTRIRHTITNIKYLDDKLSAEVSYTSLFQGKIKKHIERIGISFTDFKSLSVCTDILKLVKEGIKGYRADCRTEIIYGEPVPAN